MRMKNSITFFLFFLIAILLYALINYYIIRKGFVIFQINTPIKWVWISGVIIMSLSFLLGRWLEKVHPGIISTTLIWVGAFWLAIMVYLLLQFAIIDLIRLSDKLFHFLPPVVYQNTQKTNKILTIIVISLTFIFIGGGYINTWFPKIKQLNITINKNANNLKSLHIVSFSDVHLGTLIGKKKLSQLVKKVNTLQPDIILIPGDIIDEDVGPVIRDGAGPVLKQFKAKYGVYAVTGNHEYMGGVEKAKEFLSYNGITLLNDTAVLVDDSFYLVGREDRSANRFGSNKRKPLNHILENVNKNLPVILLDHQPFKLKQAVKNNIDLQLSGHTHHGQLWPFNFITELIYEIDWGYLKKENTHFYVSGGVGGWGPPIRTVNRPEILNIFIHFN